VHFFRCPPPRVDPQLYTVATGAGIAPEDIIDLLWQTPTSPDSLLMVDDFHLLEHDAQARIAAAATMGATLGWRVVLSGRRHSDEHIPAEQRLVLRRLPAEDIRHLVRDALARAHLSAPARSVQSIVGDAAGVPFFAVELARHLGPEKRLALPLLVVVTARLDALALDHKLLQTLARAPDGLSIEDIARQLGESPETLLPAAQRAVASGVLTRGDNARLAFSHPLLSLAIDHLAMEQQ
jgi:hypothetical protein